MQAEDGTPVGASACERTSKVSAMLAQPVPEPCLRVGAQSVRADSDDAKAPIFPYLAVFKEEIDPALWPSISGGAVLKVAVATETDPQLREQIVEAVEVNHLMRLAAERSTWESFRGWGQEEVAPRFVSQSGFGTSSKFAGRALQRQTDARSERTDGRATSVASGWRVRECADDLG